MSEAPTDLVIVPEAIPTGLILASTGFLKTLAEVEAQARDLKITDAASAQLAASLQIRLTDAGSQLEKQRKALKAPFIEINRKIDEAAREPASRVEVAKNLLRHSLVKFESEQRRLAEERERERQAELRRLEAIRQKEIEAENARKAELERIAREAAAKAPPPVETVSLDDEDEVDFDEAPTPEPVKTATQVALEAVQHAPVAAPVRPMGITFRESLVPVVTDLKLVPEAFIERTPKMRAIIATFCAGWRSGTALPVCPGVEFQVKKDAVSTGRSTF